jgi:hypothetical protein
VINWKTQEVKDVTSISPSPSQREREGRGGRERKKVTDRQHVFRSGTIRRD